MSKYYVYGHYILGSEEPFYIGKGKEDRAWSKTGHNVYWDRIVKKYDYEVKLLHENLDESTAHKIETELITKYGRKNIKTGCLVNMTDGGEGASGITQTPETKEKRRNSNKRTWNQPNKKIERSLESKKRWENPQYKERTKRSIKEAYKDPELRKLRSEITRKLWETPESREKMIAGLQKARNKDGYPQFISERIKQGWTDEHKKVRSKEMKDRWKDPEFRKMMLERRKKSIDKRQ
jgi:hypothetical protein